MIINNTLLEEILKSFLQKKISFEIDGKIFKTGKVILFTQKYFYINFILNTPKKKQEKFDIPIPYNFEINKTKNQCTFDYSVEALAHHNKDAADLLQQFFSKKNIKNKFFNKILKIHILNE